MQRSHPQNGVNQTYLIPGGNTDDGDQYTGLDRFGRVVEVCWVNVNTNTATDDFLYSYDRDGNVLTRTNALHSSFTEQYSYEGLNRLERGNRRHRTMQKRVYRVHTQEHIHNRIALDMLRDAHQEDRISTLKVLHRKRAG